MWWITYLYLSLCTLSSSQHQSWIRHVIPQVYVCSSAQKTSSCLQRYIRLDGNCIGADHWPIGTSLALNLTTPGIPVSAEHIETQWVKTTTKVLNALTLNTRHNAIKQQTFLKVILLFTASRSCVRSRERN